MRVTPIFALLLALITQASCGEDGLSTAFEGVYTIETWTENDGSCDSEGPSILEQQTQTLFFLRVETFLFSPYLRVRQCSDLASCQAEAADPAQVVTGGWRFDDGSDAEGWTRLTFSNEVAGSCSGTLTIDRLTSPADGALSIRTEIRTGVEFEPNTEPDDAACPVEIARMAAEGQPCTYLEVVTATFAGPI